MVLNISLALISKYFALTGRNNVRKRTISYPRYYTQHSNGVTLILTVYFMGKQSVCRDVELSFMIRSPEKKTQKRKKEESIFRTAKGQGANAAFEHEGREKI